ncbi:hypothetical protein DR864_02105 [Runella rosea]|uniref:GLPGLI family protein n=1 Tax=Runella rosea TaxID=2259595 RepID=A0A344TD83_9BACT|nr:GLPGLI family protein [Runella rosea]AXE16604.1 hypothetical protein DR864_02105 [Runella rosea]
MKTTIIALFSLFYIFQTVPPKAYKVSYRLVYQPDSTNSKRVGAETFFLYLNKGESSIFGSEGRFKSDSIRDLVNKGVLPQNIQMDSEYRFKTNFRYFVCKEYTKAETMVHEALSTDRFIYPINTLDWKILTQQDSVAGYLCTKATTSYAGRDYEAWFTTEIPIADGPHVFKGLPGLIVKLNDVRNHYVFVMQSFQEDKIERTYKPVYMSSAPVPTDRAKVFSLRTEFRKDRFEYISRRTGRNFKSGTFTTPDGVTKPASEARVDRSWDNNPLELKP